jgi:hypothetical protein
MLENIELRNVVGKSQWNKPLFLGLSKKLLLSKLRITAFRARKP